MYAAVWVWAAIKPVDRSDWMLENILVVAGLGTAAWLYHHRPQSAVSSILLTVFMILHTVGSHYTYSLVPFGDWMKSAFGFERNHYDRIIHFSFGFLLVYPVREMLLRKDPALKKWAGFLAFTIIGTCSGIYEQMEWLAAATVDPDSGQAFLGTQGDTFDSQKDECLAMVGALGALLITRLAERRSRA